MYRVYESVSKSVSSVLNYIEKCIECMKVYRKVYRVYESVSKSVSKSVSSVRKYRKVYRKVKSVSINCVSVWKVPRKCVESA